MRVSLIVSEYRNDYVAIMVCEHCGLGQVDKHGYHDENYRVNVIPKMHCRHCGKNRSGESSDVRTELTACFLCGTEMQACKQVIDDGFQVKCTNPKCSVRWPLLKGFPTEREAITAWNNYRSKDRKETE